MNAKTSLKAMAADLTSTSTSITVTVRYFAALRETLGCASESVPTQASTVGQLREQLRARGAPYAQALQASQAVRMALDQVLCQADAPLHPGAEVAFFPPVTGG